MDREQSRPREGATQVRRPMHFVFPLSMGLLKCNGIGHGSNYKNQMDIWSSEALDQIEDKIQHKRCSTFSK